MTLPPRPESVQTGPGTPKIRRATVAARTAVAAKTLYAQKQELEAQRQVYRDGLPHLYGFPLYGWAKGFIDSTNRMNLICAANQISKSSTQIRKHNKWATSPTLWPKLWATTPRIFWYLYPSRDVATIEFETKWIPEFMPRGVLKTDPVYGWEAEYEKGYIKAIHWNSGVTTYFKSYSQGEDVLQTATVHAIFCDEELPENLYSELVLRLAATDGYFHMVFTATLNQDMWRRAIEGKGEQELFVEAYKQQVSMYDCLLYADGTPSPWTIPRIKRIEATCSSQTEIDRRVHGKFVTEIGRKVPNFDASKHFTPVKEVPADWRVYPGIDVGSGEKNHPGAIAFVAINPAGTLGWVVEGLRMDGERTTAGDVLDKYVELSQKWRGKLVVPAYDHQNRDMATLAERAGIPILKANKAQDYGTGVINTLFKNNMLFLFDTPEMRKLGSELVSLMKNTPKTRAKDDFFDALRYAAVTIAPWDWERLNSAATDDSEKEKPVRSPRTAEEEVAEQIRLRRGEAEPSQSEGWGELDDECDFWNASYG